MRTTSLLAALTLVATPALAPAPALAQDADRSVEDGGVHVDGWQSRIDRRALSRGSTTMDSRMAMEGNGFRLSVGPAGFFWNPANTASGDYEVMATFQEHAMSTDHPHPYGIFIGGRDLESETEKLMYCTVYADGTFIVRGFNGSEVEAVQDKTPNDAINQADDAGEATNEIGWRVADGTATCVVNGTDVASFAAADVASLDSFDGVYGIRVSHNVELTVSDFGMAGGM